MEQESKIGERGNLVLENRKKMLLDGVKGILSFSEEEFTLSTSLGKLTGEGRNLFVESLDREAGKITITGDFDALYYHGEPRERTEVFGWLKRKNN